MVPVKIMSRKKRREMHFAINQLSHADLAKTILGSKPNATRQEIDDIAKKVIEQAHRIVSPR